MKDHVKVTSQSRNSRKPRCF